MPACTLLLVLGFVRPTSGCSPPRPSFGSASSAAARATRSSRSFGQRLTTQMRGSSSRPSKACKPAAGIGGMGGVPLPPLEEKTIPAVRELLSALWGEGATAADKGLGAARAVAEQASRIPLAHAIGQSAVLLLAAGVSNRLLTRKLVATGALDAKVAEETAAVMETGVEVPAITLESFVARPLSMTIWATCVGLAVRQIVSAALGPDQSAMLASVETFLYTAWQLVCLSTATWGAILYSGIVIKRAALEQPSRARAYATLRLLLSRAIAAAATIASMFILRLPALRILSVGGIGASLIGIFGREIVSDVVAGLRLLLTKGAVNVGDFVEFATSPNPAEQLPSGHVVDMSLTTTTLLTADATHVTIPNTRLLGPSRVLRAGDAGHGVRSLSAEFAIAAADHERLRDVCVQLDALLHSHPAVLATAVDGALRTGVTTRAGAGNTLCVRMQAYLDVAGRSEEDVERIRRWILSSAAALVFPTTRGPEGGGAQQPQQQQRKGGNGKPAQQDKPQERPPHEGAWT